jgi:membrane protease YdiL (CAAX protease family)
MTFLILGADIVISELSNIMQGVFPIDPNIGDALMGLFNPEKGYFNSFLLVVILAPLFEEIVFRGFIFRGLLAAYSPQKAGLISSVLFGAFHMNIWQFPGTVIWGIIASWWFFQTGSLLYCIYGHLFMNGVGFVAMILKYQYQIVIPGFSSDYYQATAQPSWFTIMGIMFFVTGVFILFRMFHRHNNCPSGR